MKVSCYVRKVNIYPSALAASVIDFLMGAVKKNFLWMGLNPTRLVKIDLQNIN